MKKVKNEGKDRSSGGTAQTQRLSRLTVSEQHLPVQLQNPARARGPEEGVACGALEEERRPA
ncbi:Hypothetical protein SMAX5B_009159, partial [Scophthalmus maximus]